MNEPQEVPDLLTLSELEQIEARWSDFDDHEDDFHRLLKHCKATADLPRATVDDNELKKLAARIIDTILQSPCVVETRCFSQPEEVDRLEAQVVELLSTPRATEGELTVGHEIPHDNGKLIASIEDGKWYLCAQTPDGDNYINLDWPKTWPKELSAEELRLKGFEIL